jgi:hypothetical protein
VLLLSGAIKRWAIAALPVVGFGALIAVLLAARRLSDHSDGLYQGGLFALSVAVALLVLALAVAPGRGAEPLLAWRPLRAIGMVSYGLYLYHWPVFIYVSERTTGRTGFTLFALRCAVTAAAAIVSYFLVERPIRERRFNLPGRTEIAFGLVAAAAILLLTTALPVAKVLPTGPAAPLQAAAAVVPGDADAARAPAPSLAAAAPSSASAAKTAAARTSPAVARAPAPIRILGAGDSVGFTFVYYWPLTSTPGVTIDGTAALGCRLQDGVVLEDGHVADPTNGCPDWRRTWLAKINAFHPDVVVLFATEWETFDSRVNGHDIRFGTPASDAGVRRYLDDLRAMTHAEGARLVLVASPPITAPDEPNGNPRHRGEEWRVEHLNDEYRAYAAAHPDDVSVLGLDELICSTTPCSYKVDGARVFDDGLHFDPAGMRVVAPKVLADLRGMVDGGHD